MAIASLARKSVALSTSYGLALAQVMSFATPVAAQRIITTPTTSSQGCVDRTVTPWVIGHERKDGKCVAEMTQDPVSGGLGLVPGISIPGFLPTDGSVPLMDNLKVSSGCKDFSAWGAYLGDTSKPLPSCWGNFFAPTTGQRFPSMTGIFASSIGDKSGEAYTQGLIQWKTQYPLNGSTAQSDQHSESGLAINTLSVTGGGGIATNPNNEKVGLYMPTILGPGGSNTWAINTDVTALAGAGHYPIFGYENDITNFNGPYTNAPDSFGVSASYFNTFLSSFPITGVEVWSAANQAGIIYTYTGTALAGSISYTLSTGTLTTGVAINDVVKDCSGFIPPGTRIQSVTSGTIVFDTPTTSAIASSDVVTVQHGGAVTQLTVALTSGSAVAQITSGTTSGFYQGMPIKDQTGLFPAWTHVQSYTSTTVTLTAPASATLAKTTLSATPSGSQFGILVNSFEVVSDTTIYDGGNSQISYQVAGSHQVGLSFQPGTQYAIATSPNQPICQNGLDACGQYVGNGIWQYSQNGGVAYRIKAAANGSNFPVLANAPRGFGATVVADGADANINLQLQAKGLGGVLVLSNLLGTNSVYAGTSLANNMQMAGAPSSFGPTLLVNGTDPNISLVLQPKGASPVAVIGPLTVSQGLAAASYAAGSDVGVSCPAGAVNLSTLTVTKGIVTHC